MDATIPGYTPANSTEATVDVNDLDTFVQVLTHWHSNKVALIEHMKTIPDGTEVQFEEGMPASILTGDLLKGFQLGLAFSLSELGKLPFEAEMEDDEVMPASQSGLVG